MSLCEECKVPAAVGWGNPPVWLCMEHFEERLTETDVMIRQPVKWLCRSLFDEEVVVQADYSQEPKSGGW